MSDIIDIIKLLLVWWGMPIGCAIFCYILGCIVTKWSKENKE